MKPILMMTGSALEPGGIQASAEAVLNKPFGFKELRQAVTQLLAIPGELNA